LPPFVKGGLSLRDANRVLTDRSTREKKLQQPGFPSVQMLKNSRILREFAKT
jgi:hypothetical protein